MKRTWLEVERLPLGRPERFCLDGFERVVIGRAAHVALRRPFSNYSREHAALTRLDGRWQVADLGSSGGTFMNKARIATARWLDPGDVFQMNGSEQFRFLEEAVDPRFEAQAKQLADGDDSDAAWLVFADALQERGDETGKRMVADPTLPALPLGFLERMKADDTVLFELRHGFVRRLTLRNRGLAQDLGPSVVPAILAQPIVQFVRELELDLTTFSSSALQPLSDAVQAHAPASLKVLRLLGVFGPPLRTAPARYAVEWAPI